MSTAMCQCATFASCVWQVGGRGTVDGVATMISIDLPTYLSLLGVTGFLAPLLEETGA